jgi:ABC-2 type transport system permease protein
MNMTLIKKEIKENFFAMKGFLWLFVVALLFSGMTYSFITVKALSLLAQSEVIVTMSKMILGVSLLIILILSAVSFSNEKEQSTLESLMLTPITGFKLAFGKLMGVMFMWLMIFIVAVPYIMTLSYGTTTGTTVILFILLAGTVINFIYATIAMSLSIVMGSSKNAMITGIVLFLITAIPSFLSTTMKKVGFGLVLEKLSPLSNVTNIMKGVLINKQGLLSLSEFILPLILSVVLGFMILRWAIKKFSFEGGE